MTHNGKRSIRRRHLQIVGVDGLKACCNAHRARAKYDGQLLCVTNADGLKRFSSCPTCRTVLVIDSWRSQAEEEALARALEENCTVGAGFSKYTREMASALAPKPPEMPEERIAGEFLPRLETTVPLPWWQTTGALGAAVLLLLAAAVVVARACHWLGH